MGPANSIDGTGGTAPRLATLPGAAPSFGSSLQQVLAAAGGPAKTLQGSAAREDLAGKRSKPGVVVAKSDPGTRKSSPATQESTGAGIPTVRSNALGAGSNAWNFGAVTTLLSSLSTTGAHDGVLSPQYDVQEVTSGTAIPSATSLQPSASQDDAPAQGTVSDVTAVAAAAEGASINLPEASSFPDTLQQVGDKTANDATPVELPAAPNSSVDLISEQAQASLSALGSGHAGSQMPPRSPTGDAKAGMNSAADRPHVKQAAVFSPQRLEAARPTAAPGPAVSGPAASTASSASSAAEDNTIARDTHRDRDESLTREAAQPGVAFSPETSGLSVQAAFAAFPAGNAVPVSALASMDAGAGQTPSSTTETAAPIDVSASRSKSAPGGGGAGSAAAPGHLAPWPAAFSPLATAPVTEGGRTEAQTLSSAPGSPAANSAAGRSPTPAAENSSMAAAMGPGVAGMHLIQSLGRSEMQVHINAAEFGRVSVHATLGREGLAAQISLENTDLGSALSSALSVHVPAMEQKLSGDPGSRASVSVSTDTGAGSGNGGQGQGGTNPDRRSSPSAAPTTLPAFAGDTASFPSSAPVLSGTGVSRRLDIRI